MTRMLMVVALLPRNACVLILQAYRVTISPLYGNVCRYHPSCSRYTLEAIQQYGVVAGVALGSWRLLRCNPWSAGGVDDIPQRDRAYPTGRFGLVLPRQPSIPVGSPPALLTQRTRKA